MARVLSSLSGGEAGWTLTSCLCRGDTDWGLRASPCSSALALLPGIRLGICSEFTPSSHLFFMLQLSGGAGTWMPVGSRYDKAHCMQMLWKPLGECWSHKSTSGEEKSFLHAPSSALCQSFPPWRGQMFLQQCSPQLDVTGRTEPHRAFILHVYSKPHCTSPSHVFRCKNKSPVWVDELRLWTCSTCLSIASQAVLYSCAKNVFHAQLPELCLI